MKIFNSLFPTKAAKGASLKENLSVPSTRTPHMPPAADVFIDLEPPVAEQNPAGKLTKLKVLSSKDLTEYGRDMGYQHHDMDICQSTKESIRAEMGLAIEMEVEHYKHSIRTLDVEIAMLQNEPSSSVFRRLKAERENLDLQHMDLIQQQFLLAGNSGCAEYPLSTFEAGFKVGLAAYVESVILLTKYQG